MREALRALPGMGPPLPGLPEGPRINKSMAGGGDTEPQSASPSVFVRGSEEEGGFPDFIYGRGEGRGRGH